MYTNLKTLEHLEMHSKLKERKRKGREGEEGEEGRVAMQLPSENCKSYFGPRTRAEFVRSIRC